MGFSGLPVPAGKETGSLFECGGSAWGVRRAEGQHSPQPGPGALELSGLAVFLVLSIAVIAIVIVIVYCLLLFLLCVLGLRLGEVFLLPFVVASCSHVFVPILMQLCLIYVLD